MKNFIQPGDNLTVTAPVTGIASGTAILIGNLFGVAAVSAPPGGSFEISVEGDFDLPKAANVAFALGDKACWDSLASDIAQPSAGLPWVGVVTQAALASASLVRVRLNHNPMILKPMAKYASSCPMEPAS